MGLLLSVLFVFAPMLIFALVIYSFDRYEKEPRSLLLGVFMWGLIVAGFGAFIINTTVQLGLTILTDQASYAELATSTLVAPVIEEFLKGLAVLLVFIRKRSEFDSILDGIIYAGITALGFAALENTYYIYTYGYLKNGMAGFWVLVFVRVILVGWQHPFYTAFFGIGLAIYRTRPAGLIKKIAPLAGFGMAVLTHSLHNSLTTLTTDPLTNLAFTAFDWFGWGFMLLFIFYCIRREKGLMQYYLYEELSMGTLTPTQYETACNPEKRWRAHLTALGQGNYRQTLHFYQQLGELTHKKAQFALHGDEQSNSAIIHRLRAEITQLSPFIPA